VEDFLGIFMVFLSLEGLQLGFDEAFFMICKCIFHAKLLE
jgi:hypothetical protein